MLWSGTIFPLFLSSFSSVITLLFVLGRLEAVESTTQQHESSIQDTKQAVSGLSGQMVGAHREMAARIDEVQRDTATRIDEVQREQRDTVTRIDQVQVEIGETAARLGDVEGEKV